jgi:hypothetical protein
MEANHAGHSLSYFLWVYVAIFASIAMVVIICEKTFIP